MSLNGTRQLNDDIIASLRGKCLLGAGQIIGPADVEPLAFRRKRANLLALVDQSQNKVGEIQVFAAFNVLKYPRLVDIDAHAHMMNLFGLLAISNYAVVTIEFKHA